MQVERMKERIFFDDARKLNIEIGDIETGAIYISVDQDISIIVAFFLDKLYEYICIKIENWKRVRVIVTRSPRPVEQFSRDAINKLSLLLSIDHDRVTTARYALRRLISRRKRFHRERAPNYPQPYLVYRLIMGIDLLIFQDLLNVASKYIHVNTSSSEEILFPLFDSKN